MSLWKYGTVPYRNVLKCMMLYGTIKDRMGFALIQDHIGDPIAVVTQKTGGPHGTWTLTGDLRIRFPSARSAKQAY
jgi:hypothetical protein